LTDVDQTEDSSVHPLLCCLYLVSKLFWKTNHTDDRYAGAHDTTSDFLKWLSFAPPKYAKKNQIPVRAICTRLPPTL